MRQVAFLTSLLGFLPGLLAEAQDKGAKEPQEAPSRRFFDHPVDLWKTDRKSTSLSPGIEPEDAPARTRVSIWAEPIRMPDGRFSIYVPPKQVLEFLEDPTPKTLQAYLAWKKARAEKLRRAMALLREWKMAQRTKNAPTPAASAVPLRSGVSPNGRATATPTKVDSRPPILPEDPEGKALGDVVHITYFHQHG